MKFLFKQFLLIGVLFNCAFFLYNLAVYNTFLPHSFKNTSQSNKSPTIFCIILTSSKSLVNLKSRIIYETWGKKCDNYKFISALPNYVLTLNDSRSAKYGIELDYGFDILQPPGLVNDTYDRLTDKVLLTFKYLYNKYKGYDWYLKADDDTFIFVDNLRQFLSDKNSSWPVTYGYDFKVYVDKGYHSGGGGYVLSNEALSRLGSTLNKDFKFCQNTGTEDLDVARCLRNLSVFPNKSIDKMGRERFHPLSVYDHFYGNFPDWLIKYASNPVSLGLNCCSDTSISFHYMSPQSVLKLDKILKEFNSTHASFEKIINKMELKI